LSLENLFLNRLELQQYLSGHWEYEKGWRHSAL